MVIAGFTAGETQLAGSVVNRAVWYIKRGDNCRVVMRPVPWLRRITAYSQRITFLSGLPDNLEKVVEWKIQVGIAVPPVIPDLVFARF